MLIDARPLMLTALGDSPHRRSRHLVWNLGSCWAHAGLMLDSSGLMLDSCWTHLGSCWAHAGLMLGSSRLILPAGASDPARSPPADARRTMLGSCGTHAGVMCDSSGLMLGSCGTHLGSCGTHLGACGTHGLMLGSCLDRRRALASLHRAPLPRLPRPRLASSAQHPAALKPSQHCQVAKNPRLSLL